MRLLCTVDLYYYVDGFYFYDVKDVCTISNIMLNKVDVMFFFCYGVMKIIACEAL